MTWLFLTIISAVTMSLSRVLQRILLRNENSDSYAFSFIFPVLVSVAILGYTLVTRTFEFPNLMSSWVNVILMIVFYSVGSICVYESYKQSPASEVSIIFASSSAWSAISAVLILGEKLSIPNMLGIILITVGLVVINYAKSKWIIKQGHIYAFIGAIMFGVAFTNDALIINKFQSVPPYVFLAFILPALAIFLYRPSLVQHLHHFFSKSVLPKLLLTASIYATSAICIYTAYKVGGKASIISPIQQTSVIITLILSYFLLNEKENILQKSIGALAVFVGAVLLI